MSDFGAWHSFVVLPWVPLVCLHVPQAAPSVILWWHPELGTKCHHIHAMSWWRLSSSRLHGLPRVSGYYPRHNAVYCCVNGASVACFYCGKSTFSIPGTCLLLSRLCCHDLTPSPLQGSASVYKSPRLFSASCNRCVQI